MLQTTENEVWESTSTGKFIGGADSGMTVIDRQEPELLREFETLQIIFGKLTSRQKAFLFGGSLIIVAALLFLAMYTFLWTIVSR